MNGKIDGLLRRLMSWYKDGLKFKCTGCGQCCTGEPGYVWLSPEEVDNISAHLNISKEKFIQTYTRSIFGKLSLREDRITYDCTFLKDNRCQIYSARPSQCRTFPWWKENISSSESWKEVAKRCEGVDHPEAPVIPLEVIELESSR
jgi:Fe-S-cluster containining protein